MYEAIMGSSIIVKESFLSSTSVPLLPDPNEMPLVALFDKNNRVLLRSPAAPGNVRGEWTGVINVPAFENLLNPINLNLLWRFKEPGGNYHHVRDVLIVQPHESRDSDFVVMLGDAGFTVTYGFDVNARPITQAALYDENNKELYSWDESDDETTLTVEHASLQGSSVFFPIDTSKYLKANLNPYTLITATQADRSRPSKKLFNRDSSFVFVVNPSIVSASMSLHDYINKARVSNVIPELDYSAADLLSYLNRGLSLFNSYPPQVTGFTGRAMMGSLRDCWLICSSYYILTAQIQAEGASAFNFSGQSVSLDMDRTSALESAISRLESLIDSTVKPYKKNLVKAGVFGGDGNIQGALSFGPSFGKLMLTNNPLTLATSGFATRGARVIPNFPFSRGKF